MPKVDCMSVLHALDEGLCGQKVCNDEVIIDSNICMYIRKYICMLKINLPVNKVVCSLDKTYHHTCVYQH